jgi:integrase
MSVYKPAQSRFWAYDFQQKGRRFHGSTGVETRRAAERIERELRRRAAEGELDDAARLTLDQAAGRWWQERGSTLKGGERLQARIDRMLAVVGAATPIGDITTDVLARAIQTRRGQTVVKSRAEDARAYLPSNATVNRDMIDTLRPILNRARKAWGARLPEVNWQALRMKEPRPKPKELAGGELDAVLAEVLPHWHDFVRFASRYGCRLSEMFFSLDDLDVADLDDARVRLRERKGDDDHVIPLLPEDAAMLKARLGRARSAGLETVWFREVRHKRSTKVRLLALTYNGASIALRRAMTRSGLRAAKGMRGAHDLRHHSGMQILRATGNLRLAQRLLGHADIKSTMVYAHAVEDDVKRGLAAMSRNSPGAVDADGAKAVADQAPDPIGAKAS